MMVYKVDTADGDTRPVAAAAFEITSDGSLVFYGRLNLTAVTAAFAPGQWRWVVKAG